MREAISLSPDTSSWSGAQLKKGTGTFTFTLPFLKIFVKVVYKREMHALKSSGTLINDNFGIF